MGKTYVIVGGVAGGATAAAKIRREDEHAEIIVFERGPYVSFANCGLPYYIGGEIRDRNSLLLMTPASFWNKYRIKVLVNHEVLAINRQAKQLLVKDENQNQFDQKYDKLILSQGAQPLMPPIPGIDLPHVFSLRNVPDMDRIDNFIKTKHPKKAVIIGGGFIGLEMAEAFHHLGMEVTVVEMMPHILPMMDRDVAGLFTETLKRERFHIITGHVVKEIGDCSVVIDVGAIHPPSLELRRTSELPVQRTGQSPVRKSEIPADIVLVSAGVRPETDLARKAGLEMGPTGGVVVGGHLRTSDPDIYCVGDMAEVTHFVTGKKTRIPLAGPANRQGRIAAINATGGDATYRGALGTSVVRVFDQVVAMTGLTEKEAIKNGIDVQTAQISNSHHAGYYPGARPVTIKIVFEKISGRLVGAQVFGGEGVDKRVDVLATAIYSKLTVADLEELDLSYAPPFNTANDPVNFAGFVGQHILKGDVLDLKDPKDCPPGAQIVDVRTPAEIKATGKIKGAINLSFPEIRSHLDKLDKQKPVVIYCAKGLRGYLSYRILKANGFQTVFNIGGGFPLAKVNGWEVEE